MKGSTAVLVALVALCSASTQHLKEKKTLVPSAPDPLQRRDGANHGGGHHGGSQHGGGNYLGGGGSHHGGGGAKGHHGGGIVHHGGGGAKGHHGGGTVHHGGAGGHISAPGPAYKSPPATGYSGTGHGDLGGAGGYPPLSSNSISNSYTAPAPAPTYHAPQKTTGYYYYYYPVRIEKEKKGFFDKMKKLFEPMMYPWDSMMSYFGYDNDYDYDYDSYGHYRSVVDRASDYVPWDAINEVGSVVTQDECIELFMCQLGSYGRYYDNLHFFVDYMYPYVQNNSYYRSLTNSILEDKDCFDYSCPVISRVPIENVNQTSSL